MLANHGPPPPIEDRIGLISPCAVMLIHAEHGQGGENTRSRRFDAAAGEPKAIWRVPGAKRSEGINARPAEYEARVIGLLDRALLDV